MNIALDIIIPCITIPLICFMLFLMVWRLESNNSLVLTPFLLIMVFVFVRVMPGFMYALISGISKDAYAILVFFTSFISLVCGFLLAMSYLRQSTSTPEKFREKAITVDSQGEIFLAIIFGSILLVLAGYYLYEGTPIVTNALIALATGDDYISVVQQVSARRFEITKGYYYGGEYRGQGVITTLLNVGWPFLVSMAGIVYWKTKKIRWLCLTFILFLLSFIFIAGNGTRGPFINTIIIYLILLSLIKKISLKFFSLSVFFLVITAIFLSLYSAKMQFIIGRDDFVSLAIEMIVERIFVGNSISDVYAIEFVRTGVIELRMGMIHFRDFISVFPGVLGGVPFSNELAFLINPAGNFTIYASGTYITKPYVDFGIIGVGASFLFIGVLAGFSQTLIFRKIEKDPFHLAIGAMLIYYTGLLIMTSLVSVMSALLMLFLFYFFLRFITITYRRKRHAD